MKFIQRNNSNNKSKQENIKNEEIAIIFIQKLKAARIVVWKMIII